MNAKPFLNRALTLSLSCAIGLSAFSLAVVAQEALPAQDGEGDMDSMWADNAKPADIKKSPLTRARTQAAPPIDNDSQAEPAQNTSISTSQSTRQNLLDAMSGNSTALTSINAFKESELIKTTCWPGVGPFKSSGDGDELSDPQENKLNLQTDGDKLTSAQLLLVGQSQDAQGVLNLEMVSDFMLEALGLKGKRITEFNGYLEKNQSILTSESKYKGATLSTTSGPYVISLKGSNNSYLIDIRSKGVTADSIKGHDLTAMLNSQVKAPQPDPDLGGADAEPVQPPVKTVKPAAAQPTPVKTVKPVKTTLPPVTEVIPTTAGDTIKTTPAVKVPPVKGTTPVEVKPAQAATNDTGVKKELGDAIRAWQQHKKIVLRERKTDELSKYLSGSALAKQTTSVKWLTTKNNYYEMTPKGVTVDKVTKLADNPPRYSVVVNIKEQSKQIKEPEKLVVKSTDDSYNVDYTVEKVDGSWHIADFKLLGGPKK